MIENKFSPCQERALDLLINSSENVFLTGQAGTGKSFLVKQFLESNPYVPIVASTGRAALLVGGVTFHSFFRIIPNKSKAEIFAMTLQDRKYVNRMRDTYVIIIDEISMLSGETLALAEELARPQRALTCLGVECELSRSVILPSFHLSLKWTMTLIGPSRIRFGKRPILKMLRLKQLCERPTWNLLRCLMISALRGK